MATRATYFFPNTTLTRRHDVCCYMHWDNYLAGAAKYLYNAVKNASWVGPAQFIRFNAKCEITTAHEDHGDTEYRYDIFEGLNIMEVFEVSHIRNKPINCIYKGGIDVFINTHLEKNESFKGVVIYQGCLWDILELEKSHVNYG